jgi:hypothetical protein
MISVLTTACMPATAVLPDGAECPVTLPNGSVPPGEADNPLGYGNGELWTTLWPKGVAVFSPGGSGVIHSDGSLEMKFPWMRATSAPLVITGRRLDAAAPPLKATLAEHYDSQFQPSSLIFSTTGCWEVSARAGTATLTFVTRVVRQ